jgi:hypothetical protein
MPCAGDQDVLNIYFRKHPSKLHVLPCTMNYRRVHSTHWHCQSDTQHAAMHDAVWIHCWQPEVLQIVYRAE